MQHFSMDLHARRYLNREFVRSLVQTLFKGTLRIYFDEIGNYFNNVLQPDRIAAEAMFADGPTSHGILDDFRLQLKT